MGPNRWERGRTSSWKLENNSNALPSKTFSEIKAGLLNKGNSTFSSFSEMRSGLLNRAAGDGGFPNAPPKNAPPTFALRDAVDRVLFSASGVVLLSWLSFQEIVAAENLLYCVGMVLEFIAFVRMRMKHPAASRPYKIPIGTVGSILMCVPPTLLICAVVALSSLKVAAVSFVMMIIGFLMHPCLNHMDRKKLLKFSVSSTCQIFSRRLGNAKRL